MSPLNSLLKKDTPWLWGKPQISAIEMIKGLMTDDIVLAHYDPRRELVLSCDASPVGIGAALQQRDDCCVLNIMYSTCEHNVPKSCDLS